MNSLQDKLVLSRSDLEEILHYGHWIAVFKGLHEKFVADNYPGYTWATLIQELRESDVLVRRSRSNPYGIRRGLSQIEIPRRPAS